MMRFIYDENRKKLIADMVKLLNERYGNIASIEIYDQYYNVQNIYRNYW